MPIQSKIVRNLVSLKKVRKYTRTRSSEGLKSPVFNHTGRQPALCAGAQLQAHTPHRRGSLDAGHVTRCSTEVLPGAPGPRGPGKPGKTS